MEALLERPADPIPSVASDVFGGAGAAGGGGSAAAFAGTLPFSAWLISAAPPWASAAVEAVARAASAAEASLADAFALDDLGRGDFRIFLGLVACAVGLAALTAAMAQTRMVRSAMAAAYAEPPPSGGGFARLLQPGGDAGGMNDAAASGGGEVPAAVADEADGGRTSPSLAPQARYSLVVRRPDTARRLLFAARRLEARVAALAVPTP